MGVRIGLPVPTHGVRGPDVALLSVVGLASLVSPLLPWATSVFVLMLMHGSLFVGLVVVPSVLLVRCYR